MSEKAMASRAVASSPHARGMANGMRSAQPMLLCAALSVSLHAAVLAYRTTPAAPPPFIKLAVRDGGSAEPGTTRARVIPVRPMTASAIAETVVERQEPSQIARSAALSRPLATVVVKPAIARIDAAELDTPPQTVIEQTALASASGAQSRSDENMPSADFDGSDYIPRSQLTNPPSALAAIVLDTPEGRFAAGRYVGVLSLFIDEEGHVRHVAAEGAQLPPTFEQVARETFAAAPFSPGQIAGRNVKSRVRVEVVFDNRFE